ncbi:MAG: hypothetical protein IJM20_06930 [Clostridia bacterium]|jgi:hypothetical protein|nr:hypothetical protein [Clostridia bacterium]
MRSDTIHVTNGGAGFGEALSQAERVAAFKGLDAKSAIHLRLLTEEMMGIMHALTGEKEADFWIDDEGGEFSLHLSANAEMDSEMRKKLLSVSKSGKNDAARGVTGKLRDLFERFMAPGDMSIGQSLAAGLYCESIDPEFGMTRMVPGDYWSLRRYSDSLDRTAGPDENWDELEKSVVARLADDVRIGIKGRDVEITIIKRF